MLVIAIQLFASFGVGAMAVSAYSAGRYLSLVWRCVAALSKTGLVSSKALSVCGPIWNMSLFWLFVTAALVLGSLVFVTLLSRPSDQVNNRVLVRSVLLACLFGGWLTQLSTTF